MDMTADHAVIFFFDGQLSDHSFKSIDTHKAFMKLLHDLFGKGNLFPAQQFHHLIDHFVKAQQHCIAIAAEFAPELGLVGRSVVKHITMKDPVHLSIYFYHYFISQLKIAKVEIGIPA